MRSQTYPSDVTDDQWALIGPHLPVYPGGRPRTTDLRDVVDAVLYILRTGCQWRYLPKDFPPRSTVWRYFDEWRHNGTPAMRAGDIQVPLWPGGGRGGPGGTTNVLLIVSCWKPSTSGKRLPGRSCTSKISS